jgi:2-hydroxychromene-2-carboxylate isomerase
MVTSATWYFDFVSPFAYLQFARFGELPTDLNITLRPVLLGALLKHWDIKGAVEIPPKRRFVYRFCKWSADRRGIPFTMPPTHPFRPLAPLRLALAAGADKESLRIIFHFIYGEGNDIDSDEGIALLAGKLGIKDVKATLSDLKVKDELRSNTDAAIAQDVFGVPTFVVNDEIFWGDDATAMLQDYLNDRKFFASSVV